YELRLQRERQKVLGLLDDMESHRFQVFRSLTLLRQLALDAELVEDEAEALEAAPPSAKLDALAELLNEAAAEGHRVLVFSQFTRFLSKARDRAEAAGIATAYLDGRTRRREEAIERFRGGDAPVFFVSLKAGGFGLNLTEADYVVLLDPWWNPAAEAQAIDRTHRIGQTRSVMVYRLVAADTIEAKVLGLSARKAQLFEDVLDGGEATAAGQLTAEEIRGLVS
uniref:DEAD/DEAH box helicase n=1 Tax=Pseudactinotalea sp. TaxID=1926260 RepID=UPI003B3BD724